ncbi:unnamed protein product [[Actinomadura] parvosata subsp. kistnae]|nr:hypothetical protein [Nonomuraea sp. ATCC 55076]SPL88878.1 unnamed protein product [Actinomadura parvosata subsp. kistnae]
MNDEQCRIRMRTQTIGERFTHERTPLAHIPGATALEQARCTFGN